MAIYERHAGAHVAERVQPVDGSPEAADMAALAADPASGWRRVDEQPKRPARKKTTSEEGS